MVLVLLSGLGCDRGLDFALGAEVEERGGRAAPTQPVERGRGPVRDVRVEALAGVEPPVFVLRGRGVGPSKLVFLHGMCGHGLGYAQAFQHAAATKGVLIAPQADRVCGQGPWAKWSMDVARLDERIGHAFRALDPDEPVVDVCVMGVSQGATRAAALVRAFPERYSRLVSIGAPTTVRTAGLERLQAAVLMVGERERKDLMLTSQRALERVGVPTQALVIPGAEHASLGATPEATMQAALDWLWQERPSRERPGR